MKNLHEAREMAEKCRKICDEIEDQIESEIIEEWRAMKHDWECDVTRPDPYKLIEKRRSNPSHPR